MLIRGSATAIPLADNSVQVVVTSPPFWGLRSYSGEQQVIFGGLQTCEHEWGPTIIQNSTNHTDKRRWNHTRNGRDEEQPIEKRVAWLRTEVKQGAYCQLCGAWLGAFGLEPTVQAYCEHSIQILREIRRVLRPDGIVFWNIGDSRATGAGKVGDCPGGGEQGERWKGYRGDHEDSPKQRKVANGNGSSWAGQHPGRMRNNGLDTRAGAALGPMQQPNRIPQDGLKPKDLCLIPQRIALAAQADGWYVRSDIAWVKANPMPSSAEDRPTDAYEHILMLTKSERYFFDTEAAKEPAVGNSQHDLTGQGYEPPGQTRSNGNRARTGKSSFRGQGHFRKAPQGPACREDRDMKPIGSASTRNMRNTWMINTAPFSGAHFATFPPELPRRAITCATSDRGACSKCGTPWERIVQHPDFTDQPRRKTESDPKHSAKGDRTSGGQEWQNWREENPSSMVGWRPGCKCGGFRIREEACFSRRLERKWYRDRWQEKINALWPQVRPCIVLDPFGGAGTTAKVALEMQRLPISIDLAYHDLAKERTKAIQPLLLFT